MKSKPEEKPRCAVCKWPLAASAKEGCVAGNCSMRTLPCHVCGKPKGQPPDRCNGHYAAPAQMGEEKPLHPLARKMLVDLLPGLRYAANRLRNEVLGPYQRGLCCLLERDIAMIEDEKIPAFLEQDGRKGGE